MAGFVRLYPTGRSRAASFAACLLLFFCLTAAAPVLAAFEFNEDGWEATTELLNIARERLGRERVKPLATVEWDQLRPEDALLVLHPTRELEYREVSAFLAAGGRLALLDDYGRADVLLAKFRIHRVQAPLRPVEAVRQNPNLAVAFPAVEMVAGAEQGRHPIVAAVDRVVTNHPTALRTEPGVRLTPVLKLPGTGEPDTLLAVIGVIGNAAACGLTDEISSTNSVPATARREKCGRLFAMGDPSVVINLMMRYPGNRAFAEGLVDYLVADDTWGRRGGVLYLAANDFAQRGLFGGAGGLKRTLNDKLHALAEFVADMRRNGLPGTVAIALAALAALAAGTFMARVSLRRYPRTAPRYVRQTPLVAQGGAAGRVAVLAAPTTHRALAVLELKAALEESLRSHFGLPDTASLEAILREIEHQRALTPKTARELDKLLSEMAKAEVAVATSERMRLSSDAVETMRARFDAILQELSERREHAT